MFSIDHIGVAVKSLAAAKGIYERLGLILSPEEVVESEQVRVVMVPLGESRMELLEPTSENSVIAKFIAKQGEGLHHVSLRVPDLSAAVERLKQSGVRLVSNEIKVGAGGHKYIFVHPSSAGGVLLELVEAVPDLARVARAPSPAGFETQGQMPRARAPAPHAARIMLLLAADTSGKHGTIALARCGPGSACACSKWRRLRAGLSPRS